MMESRRPSCVVREVIHEWLPSAVNRRANDQ